MIFISNLSFAQKKPPNIEFIKGKTYSLPKLKEKFKSHIVEIYNYEIKAYEKYHAFLFNELMNDAYDGNSWLKNSSVKVNTLDRYIPLIEMYKFKERKAYLAYARADQKAFSTISGLRDKFVQLSPFYLIWKESYKKAAKRRDHWPYKISSIDLERFPPVFLIPVAQKDKGIMWGYENFMKQCIACHRLKGFGGENSGELIVGSPLKKYTDLYLKQFILNPRSKNKKSRMPAFPEKIDIKFKRITDIVKYLRYLEK